MAGRRLLGSDFPNTTNLFLWPLAGAVSFDGSDIVSGKTLTENGALSAALDHLDVSVFCDFDGTNDFLTSTDAVFAFTGSFSIGLWVSRDDWSTVGDNNRLIVRKGLEDGWLWGANQFFGQQAAVTKWQADVVISGLSSGFHHFVATLENNVEVKLYIDGILKTTVTDTSTDFTANGTLEIGAFLGGGKWIGRMADIFIHAGTVLTASEILILKEIGIPALPVKGLLSIFDIV